MYVNIINIIMPEKKQYNFDYDKHVQGLPKADVLAIPSIPGFRFRRFMDSVKGKEGKFLEIGCGGGAFIYNVKKYCPKLVICGLDISTTGVLEAKQEIGNEVKWVVGNGLTLPFCDNCFDVIALMDVIEHVYDINSLLNECKRVLKNNGILHASIPIERNKYTIWWLMEKLKLGNKLTERHLGHIQRLSINEVIALTKKAGFIINSQYYTRHIIGQLVSLFGFCIPKEILYRLFKTSFNDNITDYSINKINKKTKVSFKIKILLIIRNIWYFILTILSGIAYYESTLLKNYSFLASDIHITCSISDKEGVFIK